MVIKIYFHHYDDVFAPQEDFGFLITGLLTFDPLLDFKWDDYRERQTFFCMGWIRKD